MVKRPVPPLPDPAVGENQEATPDERRKMSNRFIIQAYNEIEDGNRLQSGEKVWGAVSQLLKIAGQERGWRHKGHGEVVDIGRVIRAEYPELAPQSLADALSDAYHIGHVNFYENTFDEDEIAHLVEEVEAMLPTLERLVTEASENPRHVEIDSAAKRRQLRNVTGDNTLVVGSKSDVGFSKKRSPGSSNDNGEGASPTILPS